MFSRFYLDVREINLLMSTILGMYYVLILLKFCPWQSCPPILNPPGTGKYHFPRTRQRPSYLFLAVPCICVFLSAAVGGSFPLLDFWAEMRSVLPIPLYPREDSSDPVSSPIKTSVLSGAEIQLGP
ncbi:hypothetical protein BD769DRAFT_1763 [Suillus cothurnatus]|nr:hypothetical protein BD769DRAFT_1763 [Suillus cothurnatus]